VNAVERSNGIALSKAIGNQPALRLARFRFRITNHKCLSFYAQSGDSNDYALR